MKKYLLLSLAMAVALPAYALDCATPPTCDELGYTQTETDCAGKFMLKCPFSDEDFFCGGEIASCSDLGYTYTVPSSGNTFCAVGHTAEYCPSDSTKYKCVETATYTQCKNEGYAFSICASGCTTTTCPYDSAYVKCTNCPTLSVDTCPSGYYESGADELCDCTYGAIADDTGGEGCYRCGTQSECTSTVGGSTLYKCLQCASDLTAS